MDARSLRVFLERIRTALPEDVKAATEIREQSTEIVAEAVTAAAMIRTAAEQESRSRLEGHAVLQAAETRAEEILAQAQRQARIILEKAAKEAQNGSREADDYARTSLEDLQQQLNDLQKQIAQGIERFSAAGSADSPNTP